MRDRSVSGKSASAHCRHPHGGAKPTQLSSFSFYHFFFKIYSHLRTPPSPWTKTKFWHPHQKRAKTTTIYLPTCPLGSTWRFFLKQQVLSARSRDLSSDSFFHTGGKKRNTNDILATVVTRCGTAVTPGLPWSCPTWAWAAARISTALCVPEPGKGTWGADHTGPLSPRLGTW